MINNLHCQRQKEHTCKVEVTNKVCGKYDKHVSEKQMKTNQINETKKPTTIKDIKELTNNNILLETRKQKPRKFKQEYFNNSTEQN